MSGLLNIIVQEERGAVAIDVDVDQLAVVIGCTSAGSGLSPFYRSGKAARDAVGHGDAFDTLAQIIEQRQEGGGTEQKRPAAIYSTPSDTDGSYGTVDNSGITGQGSVAADAASQPYGTYEAKLLWVTGGVVGTSGMVIRWSLDNGRTWSTAVGLGTATSYTIPNSNVKLDLSPTGIELAALNTGLIELKGDYNAHRVLTAGGVHGAADSTNVVTAADATDTATRVALVNDIRTQFEGHRILTAGGVHGAADTTNVVTLPAATNDSEVLALYLVLKAAYNAHIALTAGGVHGSADGTNDVTATDPNGGTFNAGDEVFVRTFGPQPGATEIADAFTALAASSIDCGIVVVDTPVGSALVPTITTGLNALAAVGKDVVCLVRTRLPDFEASETESAWLTAVAADFVNLTDSRICPRAAYGLVTDAMTSRQYRRSTLQQFAADVARVGRFVYPAAPSDRREPNVRLVDASGTDVGHDEGSRGAVTGLSDETLGNRFSCEQRLPNPNRREHVYNTVPWVLFDVDENIRNLMTRRLANAMKRVAREAGTPALGSLLFYVGTSPTTGTLRNASREALHGRIFEALTEEFKDEIDNASDAALDTGLVQIDPSVSVSGGNLIGATARLAPRVGGFLISLTVSLGTQE